MFTSDDLKLFRKKNIDRGEIERQLGNFRNGFPFINLLAAATPDNGIQCLGEDETANLAKTYKKHASEYAITKMVPASGAASRMFRDLFAYLETDECNAGKEVTQFINDINRFAFYPALKEALADDDYHIEDLLANGEYKTVISYLLNSTGLDYASLPKGLLFFHTYDHGPRTPLEEHMAEGMEYSRDGNGKVRLHFTVSPEHRQKFIARATVARSMFETEKNMSFDISWSEQKPSTDTIAVDMENNPFRDANGTILFRPGGHGALIENLNDLDEDIVFIKNIDNVVPDNLKQPTIIYKKAIGGLLIGLTENTFSILRKIEENNLDVNGLNKAITFAKTELNISFDEGFESLAFGQKLDVLKEKLNRPIRICGMVKNEGEPGGGPFWVIDKNGHKSLQIVETSQINMADEHQQAILAQATHFNPVDLVCSIKDHKGHKYDLRNYADPQTGFISIKSKDGRELKAQELPGLWNGAMAHWITLFVEVPIETFNPVKTVNDLLRPQHQ